MTDGSSPAVQQSDLERRLARLRTLTQLNQAISASLDLDDVLHRLARAAASLIGCPSASFWVVDEATRMVTRRVSSSEDAVDELIYQTLGFDTSGVGWAAANRRALHIRDVFSSRHITMPHWWRHHGLTSLFVVPVAVDGTIPAVMALNGDRPFDLDEDEHALLESLVAQAGIAIKNASLYEEMARARRAAEEATRARTELLARMSYEMRIPLNGVIGLSQLLASMSLGEQAHEYAERIGISAGALLGLVDDTLRAAKIDAVYIPTLEDDARDGPYVEPSGLGRCQAAPTLAANLAASAAPDASANSADQPVLAPVPPRRLPVVASPASAPNQAPEQPFERLRRLEEDDGPDFADEVVGLFLTESPGQLARLRAACTRQERPTIRLEAHSLNGAARVLGALSLVDACTRLERWAAGEVAADERSALGEIERELNRTLAELRTLRPGAARFAKGAEERSALAS